MNLSPKAEVVCKTKLTKQLFKDQESEGRAQLVLFSSIKERVMFKIRSSFVDI